MKTIVDKISYILGEQDISTGGGGRMGGPKAAGPVGYCICSKCGYKEEHYRAVPCANKKCPKCGVLMTRE